MNRKWIYRAVAVCTVMMLATGSMADEIPQDTQPPVMQTEAPATQAPVSTPTETSTPTAQAEEPSDTEAPAETAATDMPADSKPAEETEQTSTEAPTEVPAESTTEVPEETTTEAPEETSTEVPEETTTEAPAETDVPVEETPVADEATPDPSASPMVEPSVSPSPETPVIIGFEALPMTETTLAEKPALEQVLSVLPGALEATLTDGTVVSAAVSWSCADYEAEAIEYVFVASFAEPLYALAEGVSMPAFVVHIQASSEIVSGAFTFVKNEQGQLTLTAWSGDAGSVSVPDGVDGLPVTAVAKSAFAGKTGLYEIVIPNGVVAIEDGAFENCVNLAKVSLPDSLEQVGRLFAGCGALNVLQLDISGETSMSDARSYTRRIIEVDEDGNQTIREVHVELERAFTDYQVLSGGKWRVDGAIGIDTGHSASVASDGALYITASGAMTVNGTLSNAGASLNEGRIIACGGSVVGMDGAIVTEHSYDGGVCTVCGARQALTLTVSPVNSVMEKTYDGTSGLDLGANDFVLEGVREGDEVYIAVINSSFNESSAGSYLANVSFQLGGADASDYTVLPMELSVVIHKKQVTVSPREGQSKVYGTSDPSLKAGYRGVVSGEVLTGRLGREKGENAGQYRITIGTLAESNPNYEILLDNVSFTIEPKSIEDASVTVAKIPNQRCTGAALTPDVEVRDSGRVLVQGVDYALSYADNVNVGSAKVTISGIGNYSGSRAAGFRIIKVSSGSGGGYSFGDLSALADSIGATPVSAAVSAETMEIRSEGNLVLGEYDWGTILFDAEEEAQPFFWSERAEEGSGRRYYSIDVDFSTDEWGAPVIDEYGQPRLRLTTGQVNALRQAGYTDVELTVGEAQVRVPLNTLFAEYVGGESTLVVDSYEIRLWPLDEAELEDYERLALADRSTVMKPFHLEVLALSGEETEDVLSLLEGVQLLLTPEEAPDYQNVAYSLIRAEMDDPEVVPAPEGATFIMEEDLVKCVLTPLYGGMYALARG